MEEKTRIQIGFVLSSYNISQDIMKVVSYLPIPTLSTQLELGEREGGKLLYGMFAYSCVCSHSEESLPISIMP